MKRLIAPLSFLFLVALAGCSSTSSTSASSAAPASTAAAVSAAPAATTVAPPPTEAASQPAPATTAPSEEPTTAPVAGGTATDFCGAFKELQAISEAPAGDLASAAAQFQAAAADMRTYAPAEIMQAANTYADLIDSIGKAVASGSITEASLSNAISDGMAGKAKDIAATATWVAKNCNL
jgi:hypothetical protein